MIQNLIAPVASLVGGWMKNKAEEKQAKHDARMSIIAAETDWEAKMADASSMSWKDEFWTCVLALPLLAIFWGVMTDNTAVIERVRLGFQVMGELDDWYTYLLFLAISASFGIRGADKLMSLRKK